MARLKHSLPKYPLPPDPRIAIFLVRSSRPIGSQGFRPGGPVATRNGSTIAVFRFFTVVRDVPEIGAEPREHHPRR